MSKYFKHCLTIIASTAMIAIPMILMTSCEAKGNNNDNQNSETLLPPSTSATSLDNSETVSVTSSASENKEELVSGQVLDKLGFDPAVDSPADVMETTMRIYFKFTLGGSIECDFDTYIDVPHDDYTLQYYKVTDQQFNTSDKLTEYLGYYFNDKITTEIMSSYYIDDHGNVYSSDGGRGANIFVTDYATEIKELNETSCTYTVTVNYLPDWDGDNPEFYEYKLEKINGIWKFTLFPFFF